MPVSSQIEKDLTNFQPVLCQRLKLNSDVLNHIFTSRVINKIESISSDPLDFMTKINYNETTLGDQLNCALGFFFDKKIKPINHKWKIKQNAIQEDLNYKKQRTQIYKTMLKENIFPNYFEFKKCNNDVKLLFTDKCSQ
ncbi:uncharacterized protein LOC129917974 [Episyrphus balteatus]|uniref:uncharacterized protein LOC129917974 n=1 Tax=Episyrphus balteatus TaxID=286459 RepID=UPI002485DB03|nr:uncharacterized protein LOC129917974 [Episyrphus balteatus]